MCRIEIRKGKAKLELRIEKMCRATRKPCIYIYLGRKAKPVKKVDLFLSREVDFVTKDMEEFAAYKVFFLQVL